MKGVSKLRLSSLKSGAAIAIILLALAAATILTLGSAPVAMAHEAPAAHTHGASGEYNQTALADVRSDLDGLRIGIGALAAVMMGLNLLVFAAVLITLRRFNARHSRQAARDG